MFPCCRFAIRLNPFKSSGYYLLISAFSHTVIDKYHIIKDQLGQRLPISQGTAYQGHRITRFNRLLSYPTDRNMKINYIIV